MSGQRKAHHSGTFQRRGRALARAATANPITVCWRDGLTLAEHAPHHTGTPARWTAGHVDDIQLCRSNGGFMIMIDGRPVAAEVSTCNYTHGAIVGNGQRIEPHSERW